MYGFSVGRGTTFFIVKVYDLQIGGDFPGSKADVMAVVLGSTHNSLCCSCNNYSKHGPLTLLLFKGSFAEALWDSLLC